MTICRLRFTVWRTRSTFSVKRNTFVVVLRSNSWKMFRRNHVYHIQFNFGHSWMCIRETLYDNDRMISFIQDTMWKWSSRFDKLTLHYCYIALSFRGGFRLRGQFILNIFIRALYGLVFSFYNSSRFSPT